MLAQPIDAAAFCSLCDSHLSLCEGQHLTLSQAHAKHKHMTAKVLSWPRHPWGGQYHNRNQQHLGFAPVLSSEAHAHSPICGRKADGHRLISKPGSYSVKGCVSHHQLRKAGHVVLQKPESIPSQMNGVTSELQADVTYSCGVLIRFDFSLHK